jgi:RNA recognition motif-containing protein
MSDDEEVKTEGANALKIFVGNLPFSATNESLHDLFAPFGDIQGINIRKDSKTQNPKGFAFMTFMTESAALAAIAGRQGYTYEGRVLTVNAASQRGSAAKASAAQQAEDDVWMTAPPARKQGQSKEQGKGQGKGTGKAGKPARQSWDHWAGPAQKASSKTFSKAEVKEEGKKVVKEEIETKK